MAFVNNAHFFSDLLHFDKSLLLLTVTLRGVSNKHCLLSLFSFWDDYQYFSHKIVCFVYFVLNVLILPNKYQSINQSINQFGYHNNDFMEN